MKIKDAETMRRFGQDLAKDLQAGDVLAFSGPLGSGKTTLVQGLAQGLGFKGIVDSPTFNLIQTYEGPGLSLHHMDMYRIEQVEEAYDLGLEEYFEGEGVTVVEWPEQIEGLLPPWTQWWTLSYEGEGRRIEKGYIKEEMV